MKILKFSFLFMVLFVVLSTAFKIITDDNFSAGDFYEILAIGVISSVLFGGLSYLARK